ncbi:hypothetical protein G4H71_15500 [Rhodococcus triatomae]|uniref:hypothetical protein n=1 Tax=Rhodococcus triatomae TaxID=300028 RepID=UPI001472BEBB|nr:hypothetical protein [Rhodococcus triatomae]QNG19829.1 hypothetical protein G4H72_14870 [Rhodococcus triatomae]QNG24255.1 hypothetical protein G4H71_15500 [Rhodococcus triatomae]
MTAVPGIPDLLGTAFLPGTPGPALPPGPRDNPWHEAGAVTVEVPHDWRRLLDALWRADGMHPGTDGLPTTIARRPVPSAGATYGVRTHVVVPAGAVRSSLPPGRYAYQLDADILVRRAGPPPPPGTTPELVFCVQPGRAFGRYRHRAWPLWIADTAYAVAAAQSLLAAPDVRVGPFADTGPVALPPAHSTRRWLEQGLVPEIVLARIPVYGPGGSRGRLEVDEDTAAALGRRRSPALTEFPLDRRPTPRAATVAAASGQHWVRGADDVAVWTVRTDVTGPDLWRIHLNAARRAIRTVRSGAARLRPVSGMTAAAPPFPVHALALLRN